MIVASRLNTSILGLDRPMAPILRRRLAQRRDVPAWTYLIHSISIGDFLRDYRRYRPFAAHGGSKIHNLTSMRADRLLALFLTLKISNPDEDERARQILEALLLALRQQQMAQADEQAEAAQAAKEEAEAAQDPVAAVVNHLLALLGL